jgi:hypothetical protein
MLRGFRCSVVVLARSTCDLMAVLTNLCPCMCRGGSCACSGAVSRVVVLVLTPWSSSVLRLEGLADGGSWAAQRPSWQRPVNAGPHSVGDGAAVPEMAAHR